MKDHQRILFGDKIAQGELAAMFLAVPVTQGPNVKQQAKLVVDPGIAGLEPQQPLLPTGQNIAGQRDFAIEDAWLAHAAQSLRCTP
jgi:hypothetical protein